MVSSTSFFGYAIFLKTCHSFVRGVSFLCGIKKGVIGTKVGYTQGHKVDPTYKEVCTGQTGHTEAFMVTYDPTVVSYDHLVHLAMDRLGENKYLLNQVGNDK